jgi:hypothetical protein
MNLSIFFSNSQEVGFPQRKKPDFYLIHQELMHQEKKLPDRPSIRPPNRDHRGLRRHIRLLAGPV